MTHRKATPAEINAAFEFRRRRLGRAMTFAEIKALDAELAEEIERDDLLVDPARDAELSTGIYVRAKDVNGKWGAFDIAALQRDSLLSWLRRDGGDNVLAESVVLILLDHPRLPA